MINKLFHARDIAELYGLSLYEARSIMSHIPKINISNGTMRPRWVVKQEDVEAYLLKKSQRNNVEGLDRFGKILRRR